MTMTLRTNLARLQRLPVAARLKLANLLTSGVVIFLAGFLLLGVQRKSLAISVSSPLDPKEKTAISRAAC